MFFERIERELIDGEPWSPFPVNRMEPIEQNRDRWEVENREQHTSTHRHLKANLIFWRNWAFWKWFPSGEQTFQNKQ